MKEVGQMKQLERIQYMEDVLNEAKEVLCDLSEALERYDQIKDRIKELEAYYESDLWKKDYIDDEEGRIPKSIKRGVLSEDAVYDLLSEYSVLQKKLETMHEITKE